jgi:hypothetical protein
MLWAAVMWLGLGGKAMMQALARRERVNGKKARPSDYPSRADKTKRHEHHQCLLVRHPFCEHQYLVACATMLAKRPLMFHFPSHCIEAQLLSNRKHCCWIIHW